MHRSVSRSPETQKDWFIVRHAPHHPEKKKKKKIPVQFGYMKLIKDLEIN